LNYRETATALAALRYWQRALARDGASLTQGDPHFAEVDPLTSDEIDGLCDWLNMSEHRPCACEEPGEHLYSGVPGILAEMGAGGIVTGSHVERCDQCQRYPSDEAALAKLKELRLA
jgi:hypothetical protein